MLDQAFSFVDLVAVDAVTETEASQADWILLKNNNTHGGLEFWI